MYTTSTGKTIDFSKSRELAAGGEGRIVEYPGKKDKVLKIYHSSRPESFSKHLESLTGLPSCFVAPEEIVFDKAKKVIGFSMQYIDFSRLFLFNNLFNKGFCTSNGVTLSLKIKILQELRKNIEICHSKDIVQGDINQYNLAFDLKGNIYFMDVDSYATPTQPHSGVILDDIRDWTTLSINKQTDAWAYDILAFFSTTFCHPFKWVVPGNKESLEQRVKLNKSYLSAIAGIKIPALYQPPTGDVEKQFKDIFAGRRYFVNFNTTHTPVNIQVKQPVTSIALEIRELYNDVTHINASRSRIAVRKTNGVWMLVETAIPKVTRTLNNYDCDELYPSSLYVTQKKEDELIIEKTKFSFAQPVFYYNNGSLVVFEYDRDVQWNFDLENQMFGVDNSQTPIFAKSVVVRNTPIQNFGNQVYINIPNKNKYTLVPALKGVQDAIHVDGYTAFEIKDKSKVRFVIWNGHTVLSKSQQIDLDYLPHFAVKNNLIFVPDNGHINVYKDTQVVTTLDCSMCTRDSKLYSTDSGIMLLENNTLYLLNTK